MLIKLSGQWEAQSLQQIAWLILVKGSEITETPTSKPYYITTAALGSFPPFHPIPPTNPKPLALKPLPVSLSLDINIVHHPYFPIPTASPPPPYTTCPIPMTSPPLYKDNLQGPILQKSPTSFLLMSFLFNSFLAKSFLLELTFYLIISLSHTPSFYIPCSLIPYRCTSL
jgi:hypothetical protein